MIGFRPVETTRQQCAPGALPSLLATGLSAVVLIVVGLGVVCRAGDDRAANVAEPSDPARLVIATVDDQPIFAAEAQRMLKQALGPRQAHPAVLLHLQAQVLAEIINRRLVLAHARRTGAMATAAEVAAAIDDLNKKLQAQGSGLKQYLSQQGIEEQDLRRQLTWRITFDRLLRNYVTQQRMEQYFARHRRQLDGSEVAVSHILISPTADARGGGHENVAALTQRAARLRAEILAGKLSFEEAARQYSSSPTAAQGGRLGYIRRDGPMVESFTRAAFALEPGEISQPVVTPFGVHLIRCEGIKPGTRQLADVLQQVEDGLARHLLEELAAEQLQHSTVWYTGAWPHFKPGTTELAPQQ